MTHGGHRLGKAGWATPGRLAVATGGLCGAGDEPRGQILGVRGAPRSLWGREWPRSVFTHRVFWVPNVRLDARRGWEKPLPASPAAPDGGSSTRLCPRTRYLQPFVPHRGARRASSGTAGLAPGPCPAARQIGEQEEGGTEPAPSPPRWCSESDGAKETPLKFLLPLFCPLPHTVLPASTHARTHTTHAHSRTLGVLSLSLEEPGCSEESEEGE